MTQPRLLLRTLSSLSKVFPDDVKLDAPFTKASALLGEVFSFQIAYRSSERLRSAQVTTQSKLNSHMVMRSVDLVPCELPYLKWDSGMIKRHPGLYPDPLHPLLKNKLEVAPDQWRTLWVTLKIPLTTKPKYYSLYFSFSQDQKQIAECSFQLQILKAKTEAPNLIQTQWFHSDSLAHAYGIEVFSQAWWEKVSQFIENASAHHINMILTPLFTPPLDTQIGGERLTVQLVGVKKRGPIYQFDFSKLKKWIKILNQHDIQWIEFSHLFSQWGAKFAPKIFVQENGKMNKAFGWHTPATAKPYRDFLNQFLPALIRFIRKEKIQDRVYFHISDEPYLSTLKSYQSAVRLVENHLKDFKIIDALSDISFYKQGLVKNPIPANNHIEPFVQAKVKNLWTYYCVSQHEKVPNRFFNMPAARNRIMGVLLYKYQCVGFLHWGFNFWYSQYSLSPLNPYLNTSAGLGFPSGDAFLVYPGQDGPVDSTRHEVHREGLQDLAALQKLESHLGREKTVAWLETGLKKKLTMTEYPKDLKWILHFRERLNLLLSKLEK
jgi:hypothetical protein